MFKLSDKISSTSCLVFWSFVIFIFFIATVSMVDCIGKSSIKTSFPEKQVYLLNRSINSYFLWKNRGVKGRVIVHLGAHLGMKSLSDEETPYPVKFPVRPFDMVRWYEKRITSANYLWVAAQDNLIKKVIGIVPEERFSEVKESLKAKKDEKIVMRDYRGLPIVITDLSGLESPEETVLIEIEASYFLDGSNAEELFKLLKKKNLKYDIAIISLGRDDLDLEEKQREEAKKMSGLMKSFKS